MIKNSYFLVALFAITLLSSCELVGDIFQAGVNVGIFLVIAVIVIIVWLVLKVRG